MRIRQSVPRYRRKRRPQTDLTDKTFDERQVVLALVTPIHPASVKVGPVRLAHRIAEVSRLVFDGSVVMCLESGYVMNGNGWIGEQV